MTASEFWLSVVALFVCGMLLGAAAIFAVELRDYGRAATCFVSVMAVSGIGLSYLSRKDDPNAK